MTSLSNIVLLLAFGPWTQNSWASGWCWWNDDDQDGFWAYEDCDDNDATIAPGMPEIPDDGIDQDCDGSDASLETALLINEVHYDPSNADLDGDGNEDGDANGDGTRSSSADEFVELVNVSDSTLDLGGVTLWDDENLNDPGASTFGVPNHLVPSDTLLEPAEALVVFGGGTPTGAFGGAIVQTSTSGNLNLNNSGDLLTVQDAAGVDRLTFDVEPLSNNPNESYTRNPDLAGPFEQHDDNTDVLFSPGTRSDGTAFGAAVAGTGSFTFVPDGALSDRPVNVHYHVPAGADAYTPIVLVFHGASRNAAEYRDAWIAEADTHDFAVFAPEFTDTLFPTGDAYNLGNIFEDGDNPTTATLNPVDEWTLSLVEPLFDEVVDRTGSCETVFHAFGHSAGAQFLHRLAIFLPDGPYGTLIAANSGWYTVPDPAVTFPYGLGASPQELECPTWFDVELVVHIGSDDTDPNSPGLRHTVEADAQGLNRYDRAYYFLQESEAVALAESVSIEWELVEVPGVGHVQEDMADFAGDWLADRLD
ncbi:MAG: lamin tail domain-containing protein [Myxococcales bacterium]|nr:lamin tail domain-containing protein [Myxococcales bacterium]